MMEEMGNSRARAVYEANLPNHVRRPQTDSYPSQIDIHFSFTLLYRKNVYLIFYRWSSNVISCDTVLLSQSISLQGENTCNNNRGPNAVLTFYHVHRPWKPDVLYFPAFQFIASLTAWNEQVNVWYIIDYWFWPRQGTVMNDCSFLNFLKNLSQSCITRLYVKLVAKER